jgi:hypothetical protein
MLEEAIDLAVFAGTLVLIVIAVYSLMRGAKRWSNTKAGAVTSGVMLVAVLTLFVGNGWAEDKLPVCERSSFSMVNAESARAAYDWCRDERQRINQTHELAVLIMLGLAGTIGFKKSEYFHPISFDRAVAIINETIGAAEHNDAPPHTAKVFKEAIDRLSELRLDASYREHLKAGVTLVALLSRRGS